MEDNARLRDVVRELRGALMAAAVGLAEVNSGDSLIPQLRASVESSGKLLGDEIEQEEDFLGMDDHGFNGLVM